MAIYIYICKATGWCINASNISPSPLSLVAEQEKEFVRSSAVTVLMQDPSDRVSLQAALLISNIARFDVPRPWGTLLPDLSTASTIQHPSPWQSKFRALLALKHVLRALRTKRFIIEAPVQGSLGLLTPNQLESLGEALDHDRTTMYQQSKALLSILRVQWEGNFESLLRGESGWDLHGKLAVAGLAALRELLLMLPDVRGVESELDALLTHGVEAASTLARYLFWGPTPRAAQLTVDVDTNGQNRSDAHVLLASKCWERLLQCALVSMERHTVAFAKHVPRWAMSCVDTALVGMDAAAVHGIRSKARILLTRFVARAMLQPMYRREYGVGEVDGRAVSILPSVARERMASALPDLIAASQALDSLVSETETERCRGFVEAIVSKYVVLAPDELAEWGSDPEGFARQVDLETSLDADTPRPCGIALMEALLERNEPVVSEALLNLARSLQAQPLTVQTVLAKEAMYRTLGECYAHIRTRINFQAWYFSELRAHLAEEQQQVGLLQAPIGQTEIESGVTVSAVMKARSLWLVGVCGDELGMEAWKEAYELSVRHIASSDLVSSLMAVSATTALIAQTIEESVFVGGVDGRLRVGSQDSELGLGQGLGLGLGLGLGSWDRDKDRAGRGLDLNDGELNLDGGGLLQFGTGMEGEDLQSLSTQPSPQELEYQAHRDAIDASLDALFNGCFGLLPKVEESESMVRILQCVSVAIELLGPAVGAHVGLIAAALPRVWGAVVADNNNDNDNSINSKREIEQGDFSSKSAGRVRLHASLLAMLAHLLSKVGVAAVQESSGVVASVVLPLLAHATDISSSSHALGMGPKEREDSSFSLLDDGIALWMATLQAVPSLTPPLVDLVTTRLGPLLARGKDPGPVLRVAEAYAIHSADALEPVMDVLAETVTSCLSTAGEAMMARRNTDTGMIYTSPQGALSPETSKEATHAALLLATLVRAKISQVSRNLTDLGLQSGGSLAVVLGRLERPIMKAVSLLASEYGGGVLRLPGKAVPILEPCLDVLQHLTMVAPDVVFEMFMRLNTPPLTNMNSNKPAVGLGRVLDRWIALASARDVGEMFIPALAAVGRARRHSAAVALCALFLSDETAVRVGNGELVSATRNLHRAAQALALGLRAAIEQRAFELDQRYLADLRPGDPDHTDQLLLRRLLLARGDALRGVDAMDAVRAVAAHVAGWAGRDRIVAEVQSIDYMYGERLETILAGQLPESETDAAIASMQHAVLHE